MKKTYRTWLVGASLALLAWALPAQAAFVDPLDLPAVQSALAPRALINGLAYAGERMVAVGQRGHILYSDDAARSWKQAQVPVSTDLTAVSFATPSHGWAVGHSGVVLATQDGGASWSRQLDGRTAGKLMASYYAEHRPEGFTDDALAQLRADAARFAEEGPDKPFLDLWFENQNSGYVVGLFNMIFKTSDGGKSWTPWFDRTDNPKLLHLYAIRAVGGALYLAGEQGLLLKLDAATQRFKPLATPYQGTFFGLVGKPGVLLAYGLRGNVYRSSDGGGQWSKVETGMSVGLTGATVTRDGRIVLLSQTGQLLSSSDDGQSFTRVPVQRPIPASAVLEAPDQSFILGGVRGLGSQTPQ